MNNRDLSKFLSLVLRHKPETLGLELDEEGWADVQELLLKMQAKGRNITLSWLQDIVATNDKQRFSFSADKTKIRANQGHSLAVDLNLPAIQPPDLLYHGTAEHFAPYILQDGIRKQTRQHVHLSADLETSRKVGSRHGKPFVFTVKSGQMHRAGLRFFQSENNVWLTEYVAPLYLEEAKIT